LGQCKWCSAPRTTPQNVRSDWVEIWERFHTVVPSYQNQKNNLTSYPTDRASHAHPLRSEIVVSVTSADDPHLTVAKINIVLTIYSKFLFALMEVRLVPSSASSNLGASFSPHFTPHLIACESSATSKIMSCMERARSRF
jgi:hypothetical protein